MTLAKKLLADGGTLLPVNLTYITSASKATYATIHTFSNVDIGTAAADRLVVVCAAVPYGYPVDTLTIDGVSANPVTGSTGLHIFSLTVTSGSTANIVAGLDGSNTCFIAVYTITGLESTTHIWSGGDFSTGSGSSQDVEVDCPAGGAVICIARSDNSNSATASWSGGVTENVDTLVGTDTRTTSSAKPATTWTNNNIQVTFSKSSGVVGRAIRAASWR